MRIETEIKKYAESLGFTYVIRSKNHIQFIGHGQTKNMASTLSDSSTVRKIKKELLSITKGKTNKFCKPYTGDHVKKKKKKKTGYRAPSYAQRHSSNT